MKTESLISLVELRLQKSNIMNPRQEAEEILCHILTCSWSELLLHASQEFPEEKNLALEEFLKRREKGEPLAYIRGYQYFFKECFDVNSKVLVPRSETEILVEKCLEKMENKDSIVFDLGCGSGCIGLSVAKEKKDAKVLLFDLSEGALEVAKTNASKLGLKNIEFYEGQVGHPSFQVPEWIGKVDFVLANPPYIEKGDMRVSREVHEHEPHMALYAGNNGLNWIHKWLTWSYDYLKPGAFSIYEFGEGQTKDVVSLVEKAGYRSLEVVKDHSQKERLIIFQK